MGDVMLLFDYSSRRLAEMDGRSKGTALRR